MEVTLGKDGLSKSWQNEFPETTKCCRCGELASIGFVAHEGMDEDAPPYIYDQPPITENGLWLHDRCAVAVYFCRGCLETTALYNQA